MKVEWNKIFTLLSGFFISLVTGMYFIWGFISVYAYSYFKNVKGMDITFDSINILYLIGNIFFSVTVRLGLPLAKRITMRFAYLSLGILMAGSIFLSVIFENFITFVIFHTVTFNIGQGLSYIGPSFVASKLYPNIKGKLSSIMLAGYGLGSAFGGLLFTAIINPDNLPPKKNGTTLEFPNSIAENFPFAMKILSAYMMGLVVISFLFYRIKDIEKVEVQAVDRNESIASSQVAEHIIQRTISSRRASGQLVTLLDEKPEIQEIKFYKEWDFWLLLMYLAITNCYAFFLLSNYKSYGLLNIPDDQFISTLGSVTLFIGAFMRFIWGVLSDKYTFLTLLRVVILMQIGTTATIDLISSNKWAYLIYVAIGIACQASCGILFSIACMTKYGIDKGSNVFAFVFYGFLVSNIIQYLLTRFTVGPLGYSTLFYIFCGLLVLDFIITFFYKGNIHSHGNEEKKKHKLVINK